MRSILTTLLCCLVLTISAFRNGDNPKTKKINNNLHYSIDCAQATAQSDLDVNNVRARLLVGGDLWWNGNSAGYIIPQVAPGEPEVSSIFAGAVWMGGFDPNGNLKVAAQQFGTSSGNSDYWPGPLDASTGTTQAEVCANWDKIFSVNGEEIDLHLSQYAQSLADNVDYDIATIPQSVIGWPALGNEFFSDIFGFQLPDTPQGLAAFFDNNGDGLYTPQFGDYPIIEIRGCSEPTYPDGMAYWIFNDAGNVHTESGGTALNMEIHGTAFAFKTDDAINDMTFTRYKLINRAQESLEQTIFGIWIDADLGCSEDDYIGCDTIRDMMYVYNSDAIDGSAGDNCTGGVATYSDKIPYLGVDFFRGPLAPKVFGLNGEFEDPALGQPFDTLVEIGMSSFIFFNRASATTSNGTEDPSTAQQYYNYLNGTWMDGSPMTIGGDGTGGTEVTKFAFHDEPNNTQGWSMCTANLSFEDRRTIQSAGPFRLDPGQVNELIIGIPWVPDVAYPCPDMGRLFSADDLAQNLFNSCFNELVGPDAPSLSLISSDQKLVGILTNDEVTSNNAGEGYEELGSTGPPDLTDEERLYKFEGYLVYQLVDEDVSIEELNDPQKARVVFQKDRANQVADIYNWESIDNPVAGPFDNPFIWVPSLQVEGENEGIETTFELTTDLFTGDPLVNDETYYYTTLAYAFNEYDTFDPVTQQGQGTPFLAGQNNVRTYSIVPSELASQDAPSKFGDQPPFTRLDGRGVGGNFLSISNEERDRLFEMQEGALPADYQGAIVYEKGAAPVIVKVVDPLNLLDGRYILRFEQEANLEAGEGAWELFDAESNQSLGLANQSLENQNEQFFPDLGFSITVGQTADAGDLINERNGAIGQTINYEDSSKSWLTAVQDNASTIEELEPFDLHFQATGPVEQNSELDPSQAFTNLGSGHFAPYSLMDWNLRADLYATPAWLFPQSAVVQALNQLEELNNVDIVFTNDKSKWSRCVVVETGNRYFTDAGFELDDNKQNFEVVERPSVGKEDTDGDGRPDPDGTGQGLAWFPGYAIDVETGVRLNLFFGENSAFGDNTIIASQLEARNGSDMIFNPSAQAAITPVPGDEANPSNLVLGGMHYVYVTRQAYDECAFIKEKLEEAVSFRRVDAVQLITWTAISLGSDVPMLSYAEGLIPTETVVSLRVDNPYDTSLGTNDNASFPSYEFEIDAQTITSTSTPEEKRSELENIVVYPNPVLATTNTNNSNLSNVVKLENIPSQSMVTIYDMDGRFIKQFEVDGNGQSEQRSDLEWDLKNASGVSVASGAYFIHVQSRGIGERVLKLICIK